MATKQSFAWLPKKAWNTKKRHYRYKWIWLVWYWDDGEPKSNAKFYRLSDNPDEPPMQHHRYIRSNTNRW